MRTIINVLLLGCLFFFAVEEANGQTARKRFTSDFFVGLNFASVDIKDGNMDKVPKLGVLVGGNINYKIFHNIQIQTGFYITKKGLAQDVKRNETDQITNEPIITDLSRRTAASYFQVPLCLGLEVYLSKSFAFNINAGGYAAYGFKGRYYQEGIVENVLVVKEERETFGLEKWKRLDYGLTAKVGFIYDIYNVNLGYEYGLNNISDNIASILKNRTISLSLGFRF